MNFREFCQTEDIPTLNQMSQNLRELVHSFEPFEFTAAEFESWLKGVVDINVELMNKFAASMNAQKLQETINKAKSQ